MVILGLMLLLILAVGLSGCASPGVRPSIVIEPPVVIHSKIWYPNIYYRHYYHKHHHRGHRKHHWHD